MRSLNFGAILILLLLIVSCFCPDDSGFAPIKVIFNDLEQDEKVFAIIHSYQEELDTIELLNESSFPEFEAYIYTYWDTILIYKESTPQNFDLITNIEEKYIGKCNSVHLIEGFQLNGIRINGYEANLTD
jgi:hypothetical protein